MQLYICVTEKAGIVAYGCKASKKSLDDPERIVKVASGDIGL